MKIGIIGAGNIGSTLAEKLTNQGYSVYIANSRGPKTLKDVAERTGAAPVTAKEAAANGEIVIVSIPQNNIPKLPKDLFEGVADSVIVIDTGNYYPHLRDGVIPELEGEITESEWVQHHLGRPVTKVFNSITYYSLKNAGKPKDEANRIGLPVAGNDEKQKHVVMQLVDDLGFDPVDAGTLHDSWKQQPGTPVYCTDLSADEIKSHFERLGNNWASQRETIIANRHAREEALLEKLKGK